MQDLVRIAIEHLEIVSGRASRTDGRVAGWVGVDELFGAAAVDVEPRIAAEKDVIVVEFDILPDQLIP